jgi:4-alpha-glucanotransferase
MNIPGTTEGNWGWRLPAERLLSGGPDRALAEGLRSLCELTGRSPAQDDELLEELGGGQ